MRIDHTDVLIQDTSRTNLGYNIRITDKIYGLRTKLRV